MVWRILLLLFCASATFADDPSIEEIRELGGVVVASPQGLEIMFHLNGRELTDEGLRHVAALGDKVGLLNLRDTQVTSNGLRHLSGLANLHKLHLERSKIGDAGLEHLSGLKRLTYLNLYQTAVGDAGLDKLATGLPALEKLYVWQTKVGDEACARLQVARPSLQIERGLDIKKLEAAFAKRHQRAKQQEAEEVAKRIPLKWVPADVEPPKSNTGQATSVRITNTRKQTVKLFWSQYEGGLRHYQDIKPGESIIRDTFANAIWVVTTMDEKRLGHFFVPAELSRIDIPR